MKHRLIPFLGIIFVLLACALPVFPVVPAATLAPESFGTVIVQTVGAARTQTARFFPSLTYTPTKTALPTSTLTETSTPTATIVFVFPTLTSTPTRTATPTPTDDGVADENWACRLVSRDPANNQEMGRRTDFDARWVIENVGLRSWGRDSVDYVYLSGTKMHKAQTYDLSKNVDPGESVTIVVDMVAPRNEGDYSTAWTLRAGQTEFCRLSISIVVK